MEWILTNPFFTWLLPAASLPVLFHLFFKLKKRPRVFPTLMFFQQIDPQLSARRQIRQWLILLLRVLFILFLLLALARPVWLIGGGTGSVAVVCVVDNSGSMSGPAQAGQSKLHAAVDAARALVANLAAKDSAAVVLLVDDPTVALPPGLDSDKTPIKAALDRIMNTEATGDPGSALQRAFALLTPSSATRFEVHVFTDLQDAEWNRSGGSLPPPRTGTTIVVHRFPTPAAKQANVSVGGIEVPRRRLIVGRPIPLQVTVANPGEIDAAVRLNWLDDTDNKGTIELAVAKQSEKNVSLLAKPATAGTHWLQTWIEGDGFEADNKASLAYVCAEKGTVLFIGQPVEFGLLPLAISPAGSGLTSTFGTAADIALLKPILVVTTLETPSDSLRPFVEQGGNVLFVPTLNATGAIHAPEWTGITGEAVESAPKGLSIMTFRNDAAVFADLRDDQGRVPLHNTKVFKFSPLRPAHDQDIVFGLDDGRALFVETKLGKGFVFTSGVAFDPAWTTMPLKSFFLAIAQGMALAHQDSTDNTVALIAGEHSPRGGTQLAQIKSLAGSPLDWRGDAAHLPVFPRAGIYRLTSDTTTQTVAVSSSAKEGGLKFVTGDQAPALAGLKHAVRDFKDMPTFLKEAIKLSRGLDLFLPLLLLAILMLLLEAWVANPPPRKLKEPIAVKAEARKMAGVA